jgi:hypothetical protein
MEAPATTNQGAGGGWLKGGYDARFTGIVPVCRAQEYGFFLPAKPTVSAGHIHGAHTSLLRLFEAKNPSSGNTLQAFGIRPT